MKPVVFNNKDNFKLFGVLHEPDPKIRKNIGIILLSPGIKMRVAPHGMYKKMADHYVELGFVVLRFDFYGLGDAEGEIELKQLSNVYNTIQLGRYIDDTISAINWMEQEHYINRFVVGGLCGGAITGMLAAENEIRICGLLALGIPVALDVGEENWHKHLSQGQMNQLRGGYFKNLIKPKSWLRLLTFQSDYRVIFKSFKQIINKTVKTTNQSSNQNEEKEDDNTNPKFAPAFLNMLETSRPMLHVFSGTDRLAWEFEEKFADKYQSQLKKYQSLIEIHTIENANHILANPVWFNEMLDISSKWLKKHY